MAVLRSMPSVACILILAWCWVAKGDDLELTPTEVYSSEAPIEQFESNNRNLEQPTVWDAGSFPSPSGKGECSSCLIGNYCPLGTQYSKFNATELQYEFENQERYDNPVETYSDDKPIDRMFIAILMVFLALAIYIAICKLILNCYDKQSALSFFYDYDWVIITGGGQNTALGGMIMVFLWIALAIVVTIHAYYFLFANRFVDRKRMRNSVWEPQMIANFEYDFEAVVSTFGKEDSNQVSASDPTLNLWTENRFQIVESAYFKNAKYSDYTCRKEKLSDKTDKYIIRAVYRNISKQINLITDEYLDFKFDSSHNQVFHFFEWRYASVWDYSDSSKAPTMDGEHYFSSYIEGAVSPNIDNGFKGQTPTILNFSLLPFYFVNFNTMETSNGYKAKLENVTFGSLVNSSTIISDENDSANKGFTVRLLNTQYESVYKISEYHTKGFFEMLGIIMGTMTLLILMFEQIKKSYGKKFKSLYGEIESFNAMKLDASDMDNSKSSVSKDFVFFWICF